MAFAGKPRSNRDRISLWERCLPAMNDDAVCQINRGALIAGKPSTYRRLKASLERGLPAKKSMRCARQTAQWLSRASHAPTEIEFPCGSGACPRRSRCVVPDKLRNGLRGRATLQRTMRFPVGASLLAIRPERPSIGYEFESIASASRWIASKLTPTGESTEPRRRSFTC